MSARRVVALAAAVAALLVPAACAEDTEPVASDAGASPAATASAQPTSTTTFPLTVRNCNEDVTFEKRPESVLTMTRSGLQFMVGAGAADKVTQRSGEYGIPLTDDLKVVEDVPILDAKEIGSAEVVIGAGVDMTIGYGLYGIKRADLAKAGIASLIDSWYCGPDSGGVGTPEEGLTAMGSVYKDLERLGMIFGTEAAARATIDDLQARIDAVKGFDPGEFKTALVFQIFGKELYGRGRKSLANEQLEILGLENVITDNVEFPPEISVENFIQLDPDLLIFLPEIVGTEPKSREETIAAIEALPGVGDMRAVKAGHYVLASDLDPTPSMADGLESIARQITTLAAR